MLRFSIPNKTEYFLKENSLLNLFGRVDTEKGKWLFLAWTRIVKLSEHYFKDDLVQMFVFKIYQSNQSV